MSIHLLIICIVIKCYIFTYDISYLKCQVALQSATNNHMLLAMTIHSKPSIAQRRHFATTAKYLNSMLLLYSMRNKMFSHLSRVALTCSRCPKTNS